MDVAVKLTAAKERRHKILDDLKSLKYDESSNDEAITIRHWSLTIENLTVDEEILYLSYQLEQAEYEKGEISTKEWNEFSEAHRHERSEIRALQEAANTKHEALLAGMQNKIEAAVIEDKTTSESGKEDFSTPPGSVSPSEEQRPSGFEDISSSSPQTPDFSEEIQTKLKGFMAKVYRIREPTKEGVETSNGERGRQLSTRLTFGAALGERALASRMDSLRLDGPDKPSPRASNKPDTGVEDLDDPGLSFRDRLIKAYDCREGTSENLWCAVSHHHLPKQELRAASVFPTDIGIEEIKLLFGAGCLDEIGAQKTGLILATGIKRMFACHDIVIVPASSTLDFDGDNVLTWKMRIVD